MRSRAGAADSALEVVVGPLYRMRRRRPHLRSFNRRTMRQTGRRVRPAHHEALWPDAIYVLDRGSVLWFVPDRSRFQPAWRPGSTIGLLEALNPRYVLILMLLQMRSVFTEAAAAMPPVDVKPYVESAVLGVPKFPEPRFPAAPDPPSPAYIK